VGAARRQPDGPCGEISGWARDALLPGASDRACYLALYGHGPARLYGHRDAVPGRLRTLRCVGAGGPVLRRGHGRVLRRLAILPAGDLHRNGEPADRPTLVRHCRRARTFRYATLAEPTPLAGRGRRRRGARGPVAAVG